jgi:DNA gyrase subunit A
MAIRFDEADVRSMGRPAYGVRGMDLDDKDYIVGMAVTPKRDASKTNGNGKANGKKKNGHADAEEQKPTPDLILSVTEHGFGKRTGVDEYRLQSRGGKGVINVKTTERNGKVVGILLVSEESEAIVISQYGQIIRIGTKQIRESGRNAQGVRLLHLDGGDKVAAAVVIPDEEKDDNGTPSLIQ